MGIPNAHTTTTAERTTHTHTHTFFSNKVVTSMRTSEYMVLISLRAKRVYRNGGTSMRSSESMGLISLRAKRVYRNGGTSIILSQPSIYTGIPRPHSWELAALKGVANSHRRSGWYARVDWVPVCQSTG